MPVVDTPIDGTKVSKPAKFATAYDPDKDYISTLFVELEQAKAIVDLLYTVASEKQVDGLCDGTIESSLHTVLERLGGVKAAAEAIHDEQTVVPGQVAA